MRTAAIHGGSAEEGIPVTSTIVPALVCAMCHDNLNAVRYDAPDGETYCSAWCYRTRDPETAARLEPREVMPLWRAMMARGCPSCPLPQRQTCLGRERHLQYLGIALLRGWQTMEWDMKAEHVFGAGLGDGTIDAAGARAVAAQAEHLAGAASHPLVTTQDVVSALARMTRSYTYQPPAGNDPAFAAVLAAAPAPAKVTGAGRKADKEQMERQRSDPAKARLQVQGIIDSVPGQHCAHRLLADRPVHWCSHAPFLLARFFQEPGFGDAEARALIAAAEAVASEHGHGWVQPRDLETALFRAATAGKEA